METADNYNLSHEYVSLVMLDTVGKIRNYDDYELNRKMEKDAANGFGGGLSGMLNDMKEDE